MYWLDELEQLQESLDIQGTNPELEIWRQRNATLINHARELIDAAIEKKDFDRLMSDADRNCGEYVEEINALADERDNLRVLLRRVEWSGPLVGMGPHIPTCPICHYISPEHLSGAKGHKPDCELAKALKETTSQT